MTGHHDPFLATLSVVLAICASFVALEMAGRINISTGRSRGWWLVGGAFAMGLGIWSMHFTAMLAYLLPEPIQYEVPLWLLSIAIAIGGSLFALFFVGRERVGVASLLGATVAMAAAIAGMHYTGMAAVRVNGELSYDPRLVTASISVALVAALIALQLLIHFRNRRGPRSMWGKLASAVVMGFAIVGLHYTGMAAVRYSAVAAPGARRDVPLLPEGELAFAVVIGATVVLGLALLAALQDRRLRRTREAAAAQSRRAAALEASIDGIAVLDESGHYIHMNEAHARIYGYDDANELIGKSWTNLYDAEELHRFERDIMPAATREGRWRGAATAKRRDGTLFPQEISLAVMEGGGWVCVVRDVTERQAVEELNQRLAAIVMASEDAIVSQSADGTVLSWNPGAERMFGYSAEEMLGKSAARLVPPDRVDEEREIWQRVFAGGRVDHYETARLCANDVAIDVSLTVSPIRGADGHIRSAALTARDITIQKRARDELEAREEHFRGLIENASDLITLLDVDARVLYVSPSVRRYGFEPAEMIGQSILDYIHPDDVARMADAFTESVNTPGTVMTVECRCRRRSGGWSTVESVAWNALDNPAIGAIVVNARDVTYRQQLEERLRQAHKMEAVGRFAGGIAHDFNNLLMVLNGHLELLRASLPADTQVSDHLEEMSNAADRATRLTAQLLTVSRKQVLQPEVLDLNILLTDIEPTARRLVGSDIDVLTIPQPGLWNTRADRGQLEQVLVNLIVNGRDAMPDGGTLTIRTRNVTFTARQTERFAVSIDPGEYVRLSVADTGIGMDENTMAQVFEPFFTTKGRAKGAGLGLSTVYGIVRQSAGHIMVESEPGGGSTFIIYLPRVTEATTVRETSPDDDEKSSGETVLLVDDEPAVRNLVRLALSQAGYIVIEAANGAEGLDVIESLSGEFDIVVTDVVMPVMSGPQMVLQLRQQYPDMPVIFMSGYIDETPLRADEFTAATYFLGKPFSPAAMIRKVREALQASFRFKNRST